MTLVLAWGVLASTAGLLAYRWRRRTVRLCVLVAGTVIAAWVTVAITGQYAPDLFGTAARILVATGLLTVVAVLLISRGLPQIVSRRDRHSAALVCGVLAAMYLAVGWFLWAAADEALAFNELPEVRTRDEFIELRDSSEDPGGLLLQARISAAMPELENPPGVIASYRCPAIGAWRLPPTGGSLPARFLLELPGGPPVVAEGLHSASQAWDWPSPGDGSCALRRGDAVVAWGVMQGGMGAGGPTSYTGLTDVQLIAAGDIESFRRDYVPVAERTSGAVLALAAVNGVLAAVMVVVGLMSHRRLSREGTDEPPKITWRSGPR